MNGVVLSISNPNNRIIDREINNNNNNNSYILMVCLYLQVLYLTALEKRLYIYIGEGRGFEVVPFINSFRKNVQTCLSSVDIAIGYTNRLVLERLLIVRWVIGSIPHDEPTELFLVPDNASRLM